MKKSKTNPRTLVLIPLLFCSLSLVPTAQAVTPSPDGGYPGGNTAEGQNALLTLTTGTYNSALGFFSLSSNTGGDFNTAIGAGTLLFNTSFENTATGTAALLNTTIGDANTANGAYALVSNIDGSDNTAVGDQALFSNVTGDFNTAIGVSALARSTGDSNTATGALALINNTQGQSNTAIGASALANNSSGSGNTCLGFEAGFNVTTANNVICIGNVGGDNIENSCFIGNIYTNVQPVIGIDPDYVTIDSNGRLGRSNVNGSSRRFKHDIQPMDKASEVLFALKPVQFRYNKEYDAMQRRSFGLIAEEVAQVAPDMVGRNKNGQPDSVRYEEINAMLLNEVLKEHKKVAMQQATIAELKSAMAQQQKGMEVLTARLNDQGAQIQKVSAQLAAASRSRGGLHVSKFAAGQIGPGGPTSEVVLNDQ